MMGIIKIEDLKVRSVVGAHSWERKIQQDIAIDLVIWYDASKAAATDQLKHALDYESLARDITLWVKKGQFHLLETMGVYIAKNCLKRNLVARVWVKVSKPQALAQAKAVAFECLVEKKNLGLA